MLCWLEYKEASPAGYGESSRWTVRGAGGIATLRCQEVSGRWGEIWQRLNSQTSVA